MRVRVQLRDQPTEYLEELRRQLTVELDFRRSLLPKRCSVCGHAGHNVMTCGEYGFPRIEDDRACSCGRSDCPKPKQPRPSSFQVTCPECQGHQYWQNEEGDEFPCDTCKGDGFLLRRAVDCIHCRGKGCGECNYTGAQPEED